MLADAKEALEDLEKGDMSEEEAAELMEKLADLSKLLDKNDTAAMNELANALENMLKADPALAEALSEALGKLL